jgi:hypothetical protein
MIEREQCQAKRWIAPVFLVVLQNVKQTSETGKPLPLDGRQTRYLETEGKVRPIKERPQALVVLVMEQRLQVCFEVDRLVSKQEDLRYHVKAQHIDDVLNKAVLGYLGAVKDLCHNRLGNHEKMKVG